MTNEVAIKNIEQVINYAVQKGLFTTLDSVYAVRESLITIKNTLNANKEKSGEESNAGKEVVQ